MRYASQRSTMDALDEAGRVSDEDPLPAGARERGGQPMANAISFGRWSISTEAMTSPVVRSTACTLFAAGSVT